MGCSSVIEHLPGMHMILGTALGYNSWIICIFTSQLVSSLAHVCIIQWLHLVGSWCLQSHISTPSIPFLIPQSPSVQLLIPSSFEQNISTSHHLSFTLLFIYILISSYMRILAVKACVSELFHFTLFMLLDYVYVVSHRMLGENLCYKHFTFSFIFPISFSPFLIIIVLSMTCARIFVAANKCDEEVYTLFYKFAILSFPVLYEAFYDQYLSVQRISFSQL